MSNIENLQTIGEKILAICDAEGAEEAEVFLTKKVSSFLTKSKQKSSTTAESEAEFTTGLAIRLKLTGNLLAFTYSSDIDEATIQEIVQGAKKVAVPLEGLEGFISSGGATPVPELFDPKVSDFIDDPSNLSEVLERASQKISDFNNVDLSLIGVNAVKLDTVIMNSTGLNLSNEGSFFSLGAQTILQSREAWAQTFRHQVSRSFSNLQVEQLIEDSATESLTMANKLKMDQLTCPTILTARAASGLYGFQFSPNVCMFSVLAGTSKLGDKLGDNVASKKLTLYDDATLPGGQYSTPFDDEGSPSQKTVIIEKGVLKNFLSDSIYANRQKSRSTSNCARRASRRINNYFTREFTFRPTIHTTNFCIEPGDASDDELLEELGDGLIINQVGYGGIAITDPSGDFNVLGTHLYKVENGEIVGGINQASIKGNWFEIFKNIEMISSEREREMSTMGATSYVWPRLLISSMQFKPM